MCVPVESRDHRDYELSNPNPAHGEMFLHGLFPLESGLAHACYLQEAAFP